MRYIFHNYVEIEITDRNATTLIQSGALKENIEPVGTLSLVKDRTYTYKEVCILLNPSEDENNI